MKAARGPAAYVFFLCAVAGCSDGSYQPGATGSSSGTTSGGSTSGSSGAPGGSSGAPSGGSTSGSSGAPSSGQAGGAGNASGGAQAGTGGVSGGGGSASSGAAGQGGTGGAAGQAGGGTNAGGLSGGGAGGMPVVSCNSTSPDATCTCAKNGAAEYWFCTTFLEWDKAEAKCTAVGMHLPKVETADEDTFLYSTATAKLLGEYYLGGTDVAVPDTWVWLAGGQFWQGQADGTVTGYAHWNVAEPNASGDCVVVQNGGAWDDRGCDDERKYICEAP